MCSVLKQELDKYKVFSSSLPDIINTIANSIPNDNVPYRMKLAITMSEIVRYASQFKKHIHLNNDSLIPINSITFCIGKSGVGKDSSVRAVQKCFNNSYTVIEDIRIEAAKAIAIKEATMDGKENAEEWSVYKDYYTAPNSLEIGISTAEGLLQHFSDVSKNTVGSGYVYTGEIATELQTNTNFTDNVKIISELFDTGDKALKALKDKSKQTEVKNIAVSALLMGSADNILYDESVKKKFKVEFTSKLGRRSFFVFINENIKQNTITEVAKSIQQNKDLNKKSVEARQLASEYIDNITEILLPQINLPITLDDEADTLFELYKLYNAEESNKISAAYPITQLARYHMQWKALKVAGALTLFSGETVITKEHYINAIRYTELISGDTQNFEIELAKEAYEVFCSYCRDIAIDSYAEVSLHTLRKLGHVSLKGNPTIKMKELIQLSNSYDKDANYSLEEDNIIFKLINKTNKINISYLDCVGTKQERATQCSYGFESQELVFADLLEVLQEDLAYTSFKFKDGVRGRDNIISGCKWLILDVDTSNISDTEAHILLGSLNHFIVRTSDPNNEFKFRVIIELDAEVDIADKQWGLFLDCVGEELGLQIDRLGKSQIFFSYSTSASSILYNIEGDSLEVKPILDKVQDMASNGFTPIEQLPSNKKKEFLNNPTITFKYAYEATKGNRSRSLIRAARHAKDLGASKETIIYLLNNINNYWIYPLDTERFDKTLIQQIERWSF